MIINTRAVLAAMLAVPVAIGAFTAIPAAAQSGAEVRDSARNVARQKQDLRQARRSGNPQAVVDERQDVHHARQELRGDWYDYRRTHPGVYRAPPYVAPRGYVYRPLPIGYRFPAVYVGKRYWVTNWGAYHLPPPYAGHRWIRYGNDVVLVHSGTRAVVVVHRGFFL